MAAVFAIFAVSNIAFFGAGILGFFQHGWLVGDSKCVWPPC